MPLPPELQRHSAPVGLRHSPRHTWRWRAPVVPNVVRHVPKWNPAFKWRYRRIFLSTKRTPTIKNRVKRLKNNFMKGEWWLNASCTLHSLIFFEYLGCTVGMVGWLVMISTYKNGYPIMIHLWCTYIFTYLYARWSQAKGNQRNMFGANMVLIKKHLEWFTGGVGFTVFSRNKKYEARTSCNLDDLFFWQNLGEKCHPTWVFCWAQKYTWKWNSKKKLNRKS